MCRCMLHVRVCFKQRWHHLKYPSIYHIKSCSPYTLISSDVTLNHWDREIMAAILQTKFSSGIWWIKIFEFRIKFEWNLLSRSTQHWFGWYNRRHTSMWNNDGLLYWHTLSSNKNIDRHTAHTIVSWHNPKQWVIVHTSDLMMIMR